jgi:hypothetical protein
MTARHALAAEPERRGGKIADTSALDDAYARFYEIADPGLFSQPADAAKWPADFIVAHVVVNDQLLAATLTEVLEGRTPRHDNQPAIRSRHLEAVVRATADWPDLIRVARQHSAVVRSLAAQMGPDLASCVLPVFIRSGEQVRFDGDMPLAVLLEGQAQRHLPGHGAQLIALRRG